jgi:hypothetical protein
MKDRFKRKWFIVGLIWSIALTVTIWNHYKVDSIIATRINNEIARKEFVFHRQKELKLNQILNVHSKLHMTVESLQIGLLTVKGIFRDMVSMLNLKNMNMVTQRIPHTADSVPVNLSFRGPFEKAVVFLSILNGYACLPVHHVKINLDKKTGEVQVNLSMHFRFKLVADDIQPDWKDNRSLTLSKLEHHAN